MMILKIGFILRHVSDVRLGASTSGVGEVAYSLSNFWQQKRSVYFNRPILFDFGRLAHALDNHRRSNLLEARDVSACDIVSVEAISLGSVLNIVEDIDHNVF